MTDVSGELTVAIDFGTSNTVAVASRGGSDPRVVTLDGGPRMPSAILVTADGEIVVGGDAIRMARATPRRLELHPKSRIDEGELLLGDTTVAVTDTVRAVLAKVCAEASRQFGGDVDHLVLTHPADWGALRLGTLTRAAGGLATRISMVPEPVAAAAQHGVPVGSSLLVLDFGGGTCDAAAVRRDETGYRVLACSGLPDLGGDDLDQRLTDHVLGQRPDLAELVASQDTGDAREWLQLRQDARAAKELLSRHERAEIAGADVDPVRLDQAEFDRLVAADMSRAVELLAGVGRTAGAEHADSVYLVGGSSRLRPLITAIREDTGLAIHPAREPEMCVAWGALSLTGSAELPTSANTGPVPDVPEQAVPSSAVAAPVAGRRRGLIGLAAAGTAVVLALVGTIVATSGGDVTGTALPASGAAASTTDTTGSAPPSSGADSGMPPVEPGDEVIGDGERDRETVPEGKTGQYRDTLDDIVVDVGVDSVTVVSKSAPDGYRWVRAQVTARHTGKPGDPPFDSVGHRVVLLDDRGQHITAPSAGRDPCSDAGSGADTARPGKSVTACRDFLVAEATPIAAAVFGENPTIHIPDDRSLLWEVDIPAAGDPAQLPDPVGEVGGEPVEATWGGDFVTVEFDLVEQPSAYVGDLLVPPGSRLVVLRALVTASGSGPVTTKELFKYLDVVDDRGQRLLDAWTTFGTTSTTEFSDLTDCPAPEDVPSGQTQYACGPYLIAAETPVAGFALSLEPERVDTWRVWRTGQS